MNNSEMDMAAMEKQTAISREIIEGNYITQCGRKEK